MPQRRRDKSSNYSGEDASPSLGTDFIELGGTPFYNNRWPCLSLADLLASSFQYVQQITGAARKLRQEVCIIPSRRNLLLTVCRGSYRFGKTLGAGTYGIVREAEQNGAKYAIKIILKKNVKGNEKMVYDELEMLQRMKHPHIVHFHDWFESRVGFVLFRDEELANHSSG